MRLPISRFFTLVELIREAEATAARGRLVEAAFVGWQIQQGLALHYYRLAQTLGARVDLAHAMQDQPSFVDYLRGLGLSEDIDGRTDTQNHDTRRREGRVGRVRSARGKG